MKSTTNKFLFLDLHSSAILFTVLEFFIAFLILGGLFFTIFGIFNARLDFESRPVYLPDDYTFNTAYRKLVAPDGLENKSDVQSILATAYLDIFPDVKAAYMISLASLSTVWAVLCISIVGLCQKRPDYLIPRLMWQILAMIGFLSAVVIFAICYANVDQRERVRDAMYKKGAKLAKLIFIIFVAFSALGFITEALAFMATWKCRQNYKKEEKMVEAK